MDSVITGGQIKRTARDGNRAVRVYGIVNRVYVEGASRDRDARLYALILRALTRGF